jgi:hypothetical protein
MVANRTKPDHEELRLLYQVTVGDLTYFKTQQWAVTNYSMLLYAGLVAIAQLLRPNLAQTDRWLLTAIVALLFFSALFVLSKLQASIKVRQARLDAVRKQFTDEFHVAWAAEEKDHEGLHSIFLLRIAICGGAAIAAWLMLSRL